MSPRPSALRAAPFGAFAFAALISAAAPAAAVGWTGSSITCTMKYSGTTSQGHVYALDETQRWILGKILAQTGSRTTYAVVWRDTGQIVVPAGRWSVGPAKAPIDIVVIRRIDGSWVFDRTVSSGFSPPGVVWSGNVAKPNPKTYPAIELDFLPIVVPAGAALPLRGGRREGTTPPSYYQFLKTTPGRTNCSWTLDMP